ncbi:MAG: serine/threonine protein kinase [Deltaproteobacteria bacterium]|nr:serine/threonine protein kinase [Deltaproteobacteria bacterium]
MALASAKQLAQGRIGSTLDGKWTLDALLGYGGSAAVYAATHRNGKRAAVKILHAHCAADAHLVARFLREGYMANKIGHPGVVSVLDDDKAEDGSVYLVMELLDGASLDRHGRGLAPPLDVAQALQVADDLLGVLVAAHEKGLVHRDIKPANLFLTAQGELKILDFGIARLAEGLATEGATTQTGMLMGTPAFMPPEQARGRWQEVDARSDIWAVGATLIALMTGRRPRNAAETPAEELLAAMTAPLPSLAELMPGAPPSLVELIDRAVAFDRSQRWPSAAAMQAAVREARRSYESAPFRASTTVAIARGDAPPPQSMRDPSIQVVLDPTPQPLLPQALNPQLAAWHGGGTQLTPPVAAGISVSPIDSDVPPSLTTSRGYMRSNAPQPMPAPRSGGGAAIAGVVGLVLVLGAVGAGVFYMRTRRAPSAETAGPASLQTVAAAAPPPSQADPAPAPSAPAGSASALAPGAAPAPHVAATATATTAGSAALPATSAAAAPAARPKPRAKPTAAEGDPNKFMDSRF